MSPASRLGRGIDAYSLKFSIYMSARAFFLAASSTTMKCQPWLLLPVGACRAISKHSSTIERSTGLSKSRRLRTLRVVVSAWSVVRLSFIASSLAGARHP